MDIELERNAVREHTSSASLATSSHRVVVVVIAVGVGVVVVYKDEVRREEETSKSGLGQAIRAWGQCSLIGQHGGVARFSGFFSCLPLPLQLQLPTHSFMLANSIVKQVIFPSSGP